MYTLCTNMNTPRYAHYPLPFEHPLVAETHVLSTGAYLTLDQLPTSGDPFLKLSRHPLPPHGNLNSFPFHISPMEELRCSWFPFAPFPLSCSPISLGAHR